MLRQFLSRNKSRICFKKESNYPCGDRRIKNKNLFSKGKTKKHRFSHCVVHIGKDKEKIQNFRVTPGTLLYTRSDEVTGYTVHIFREFCNDVGILKYNIINFGIICISYKYILDNNTALIKKQKFF